MLTVLGWIAAIVLGTALGVIGLGVVLLVTGTVVTFGGGE